MNYLPYAIIFVVLLYAFIKLVSSILKGLIISLVVFLIILTVLAFIRSAKEPVEVLGRYEIDNYQIRKITE
jgi:uncharacterized membrane protein YagU involved in acid resistance